LIERSSSGLFDVVRVGSGDPELWVLACIHGDEVQGIACIEDAIDQIPISQGSLVCVPVAHRAALVAGTRLGPDGLDLNRAFPGIPDGQPTEQLAHALWNELRHTAAAVLTIHSWGRAGRTVPYAEFELGDALSESLAMRLGVPFVEPFGWHAGLLPHVASIIGIPAVELELGGLGTYSDADTALGVQSIGAALDWLRRPDQARSPVGVGSRIVQRHELRSPASGHVRQACSLGAEIGAGTEVATIRSHGGEKLASVTAPVDGWLSAHMTYGYAREGEIVALEFEAAPT
jgi:predicted deacylase